MKSNRAEYDVQPAYNESVLPTCPPSYSEAVAPSLRETPSTYQLPHPKEPATLPVTSQQPQGPAQCPSIIVQTSQSPLMPFQVPVGPKSVKVKCQYCHAQVHTKTSTTVKRSAHYCCCFLFFCGCFLCSCIPYCLASFKNVNHTCPQCKSFIGTYRP